MTDTTLTNRERSLLNRLSEWPDGQMAELTGPDEKRAAAWALCRSLEQRGYVRTSEWARCVFEKVPGQFVRITEAGRLLIATPA